MSFQYSMGDSSQRFDFPVGQKTYECSWWMIADDLAQDYFDNHDGWESSWPQTLRVFAGDKELAAFTIEMERVPHFIAYEIDGDTPND